MKTRILSLTTLIALLLTLAACSSDEAPDNFEPRLVTGEASGVTRTEAVIAGEVMLQGSTDMPELRFRYGTTDQMDHTTGVLAPDGNKVKNAADGASAGHDVLLQTACYQWPRGAAWQHDDLCNRAKRQAHGGRAGSAEPRPNERHCRI